MTAISTFLNPLYGQSANEVFEGTGAVMARERLKLYPGRTDINAQFSSANLRKTLADYKKIKTADGDYTFGALTSMFYRLSSVEKKAWEADIETYPLQVRNEIKRHVIAALTHKDDDGKEVPAGLSIAWKTGKPAVVATYDASKPSYKIEIFGFAAPALKPLAERRGK